MNKELRNCPFCGGEAILDVIEPHEHIFVDLPPYEGGAFVECTGCTCAMAGSTEAEVIEAWNRREPIDRIVEQLEERRSNIRYDLKQKAIIQLCIEIVKKGGALDV